MSDQRPTLKPCPFCTRQPHRGPTKVAHCQLHGEPFQDFAIWCPQGHARIVASNETAAAKEWNARPQKDDQPNELDPPWLYVYRYHDGVLRMSGGREINGSKPVEAIGLYLAPDVKRMVEERIRSVLITAPPADAGMREALELAYGLLWIIGSDRSTTNGNALYLARKALYERISKDGQARGITAAREAIAGNPFHNLPDPVDTGFFPRTDNRPGDASASSGAGNHVAAVRDDGDAEGATSEAGLSTVERLWNPFQTCSTTDNRPVELRFQNGDVKHGYFSSSQRRWVDASGAPLEEGLYPSHWREALTAPGATTKSDGGATACERCQGNGEIVTDWDSYLHPADLAAEEASVAVCPDCDGEGKIATSTSDPSSTSENQIMTDDQIKHMVDRFLMWQLPENFNPDAGINYTRPNWPESWPGPVGTNLFDAVQATAMVRHMLEGLPSTRSEVTVEDTTIGGITWHSSEEDSGPDVGISVYLGPDDRLWCGEISRQLFEEHDGPARFDNDLGTFIVRYTGKDTTLIAKCADLDTGREFVEQIASWVRSSTNPIEVSEWSPMEGTPRNGTPIDVRAVSTFRYQPYKPNSDQRRKGILGRWQTIDEYGGWNNCAEPQGEWRPNDGQNLTVGARR